MKKLYVEKKEEVETTSEVGRFLGFTTAEKEKGYLVFTGSSEDSKLLHAVIVSDNFSEVPNVSCGTASDNNFSSIVDFVKNHEKIFYKKDICTIVDAIFFFDTLKELHRWLGEE